MGIFYNEYMSFEKYIYCFWGFWFKNNKFVDVSCFWVLFFRVFYNKKNYWKLWRHLVGK